MANLTCPPAHRLQALNLGLLAPERVDDLSDHLAHCPDCRSTLDRLGPESDMLLERLRTLKQASSEVEDPGVRHAVAVFEAAVLEGGDVPQTPSAASLPADGEPKQFGHYRLLRRLGQGGMGTVYEAEHLLMKKTVALKILASGRVGDPEALARFRREIEAIARLDHPHLVRATDAGEAGGVCYLVMELVEGIDLARLVDRLDQMPVADACEIILQAARALEHAHAHRLIHRDVKPSNLMLTRDGQIKLLDLGLARLVSDERLGDELTGSGQLMGTADYIAPEQITDPRDVDARADVYSLGCTLYKLLCGVPPFPGPEYETAYQKFRAHAKRAPTAIRASRPDVPRELEAVVAQMMKKKPKQRFQSASEVIRSLEPFATGSDLPKLFKQCGLQEKLTAAKRNAVSTQEFRSSASVDTDLSLSRSHREQPDPNCRPRAPTLNPPPVGEGMGGGAGERRRRMIHSVVIAALLGGLLLAVGILRIQTAGGELVIETVDPDVEVRVTQGGSEVAILDLKTGRSLELQPGEYELALQGEAEGLELSARQFTIKRGEDQLVKVRFKPGIVEGTDESSGESPAAIEPTALTSQPEFLGTWQPGPAEDVLGGIVPRPAKLPGIHRWQAETIVPRSWITDVGWSPDGRLVACASGKALRVYNADDGTLDRLFLGRDASIVRLTWSPDSRMIATTGGLSDKSVQFWNVAENKPGPVVANGASDVKPLAWSPDGKWIAIGQFTRLRLWDVVGQKVGPQLGQHTKGVAAVAFSPDGRWLASGGNDSRVRLWDVETGQPGPVLESEAGWVHAVAWSADGSLLAAGSQWGRKRTFRVWKLEAAGPELLFENGEAGPVDSLAWDPAGRSRLAVLHQDGTLHLWDVMASKELATLPAGGAHEYRDLPQGGVDWHPNKSLLAVGQGSYVRIYDADTQQTLWVLGGEPRAQQAVCFSPDAEQLVSAGDDGRLRLWRAADALPKRIFSGHDRAVLTVAWSPDGRRLASSGKDATVRLWDPENGTSLAVLERHTRQVNAVDWSPDGKWLASGGDDPTIRTWQMPGGTPGPVMFGPIAGVLSLAWSPDGTVLAAGGKDGSAGGSASTVRLYDASTGTALGSLKGHRNWVTSVTWSPDGMRLASIAALHDESVRIWSRKTDKLLRELPAEKVAVATTVRWSPRSERLAVGTGDVIRLWDADGHLGPLLRASTAGVSSLAWSPDGTRLASAGLDATVRMWNAVTLEPTWVAVILPSGNPLRFTAAGELLDDKAASDKQLVYYVEHDDGAIEILSPAEFRELASEPVGSLGE